MFHRTPFRPGGVSGWLACLAALALLACAPAARAQDVFYDNTAPDSGDFYFTSGAVPRFMLDDISFDQAGPRRVTEIELAALIGVANTPFTVEVRFYDSVDFGADTGEPVVGASVAGVDINFNGVTATGGTLLTADLTDLPDGGLDIPAGVKAFSLRFVNTSTGALLTGSTAFFAPGPTSPGGLNFNVYWRDVNGNGNFTGEEARFFSDDPDDAAKIYLKLTGIALDSQTVSGTVTFPGADNPDQNPEQILQFEFRPPGSTTPTFTRLVLLNPDGSFSLNVPAGTYDIAVKEFSTLQQVFPNVVVPASGDVGISPTLLGGDADNDNDVDFDDFTALAATYELPTSDPNFNFGPDFDYDGDVDFDDFVILAENYETVGDP